MQFARLALPRAMVDHGWGPARLANISSCQHFELDSALLVMVWGTPCLCGDVRLTKIAHESSPVPEKPLPPASIARYTLHAE
eukprot:15444438-Alexandrium_andersonii.AAC.2